MIKRLMETPNARGIIIFANEDDIRWGRGRVQAPCPSLALLEDPAASSHVSQPCTSSLPLFLPLLPSCHHIPFLLFSMCLVAPEMNPAPEMLRA